MHKRNLIIINFVLCLLKLWKIHTEIFFQCALNFELSQCILRTFFFQNALKLILKIWNSSYKARWDAKTKTLGNFSYLDKQGFGENVFPLAQWHVHRSKNFLPWNNTRLESFVEILKNTVFAPMRKLIRMFVIFNCILNSALSHSCHMMWKSFT